MIFQINVVKKNKAENDFVSLYSYREYNFDRKKLRRKLLDISYIHEKNYIEKL